MNKKIAFLILIMPVFLYGMNPNQSLEIFANLYKNEITEICNNMKKLYPNDLDLQTQFYKKMVKKIFERIIPDDMEGIYKIQKIDYDNDDYFPSGESRKLNRINLRIKRGHSSFLNNRFKKKVNKLQFDRNNSIFKIETEIPSGPEQLRELKLLLNRHH